MADKLSFSTVFEMTSSLNLLYVEDDEGIAESFSELLHRFFPSMVRCSHGQQGLEKYQEGHYDIVITDIRMPIMDGITMIRHIKEINPEQLFIVTSAHNETEYFLELIRLGIGRFLPKPFETHVVMEGLYQTSKVIQEHKLLLAYMGKLEKITLELKEKNDELEAALFENRMKENALLLQIAKNESPSYDYTHAPKKVYANLFSDQQQQELEILEDKLSDFVGFLLLSSTLNANDIETFGKEFIRFSEIIGEHTCFIPLSKKIRQLCLKLQTYPVHLKIDQKKAALHFESFAVILMQWRKALLNDGMSDVAFFDRSLIYDIDMILFIGER